MTSQHPPRPRKPETPDGECCEVLKLVLSRAPENNTGVQVSTRMNFKTGDYSDALVVQFRRAKKGEPQEHAGATFAWCEFCPFCGTPTKIQRERRALREDPKRAGRRGTGTGESDGRGAPSRLDNRGAGGRSPTADKGERDR